MLNPPAAVPDPSVDEIDLTAELVQAPVGELLAIPSNATAAVVTAREATTRARVADAAADATRQSHDAW